MAEHDELIGRLRDPDYEAEMQHLRSWSDIDALFKQSASAIETLVEERDALRAALGYFINDERFQITVGGNPNAVERMIEIVHAVYDRAHAGEK